MGRGDTSDAIPMHNFVSNYTLQTRPVVQDVQYIVRNSANRKEEISLLSNVSGSLYPGELTALVRSLLQERALQRCAMC
jgi:hypothetical protein